MKQVDNEISIINENISKSDFVYQDSFEMLNFLDLHIVIHRKQN